MRFPAMQQLSSPSLRAASLLIVIILSSAATVVTGNNYSLPTASAQNVVTIETSADTLGSKFFGEGILQVIVTDPRRDNDAVRETIQVRIDADPDSGPAGSGSFTIPETGASTSTFEFYLMHVDADAVDEGQIDAVNADGVEGAAGAGANPAPIITFGPLVDGADLAVEGAEGLFEEVSFEVIVGNVRTEVNYESTIAAVSLDRTNYGSNNFVYISITDQDANLNPTTYDEFEVDPGTAPNSDLLELDGGTITQTTVFQETGANTGVFKAKYQIGSSIDADSKSLVLTLHDKANYNAPLTSQENADSNAIDQVSFTIGDTSGGLTANEGKQQPEHIAQTFDPVFSSDKPSYRLGERIRLTVTDSDANINSNVVDTIQLGIRALSGGGEKQMIARETSANSGTFAVEFVVSSNISIPNATIVAVGGDTIIVRYVDKRPANNNDAEQEFSIEISIFPDITIGGTVRSTAPSLKDITGKQLLSIEAGRQVILSSTVSNDASNKQQPFVALIEVRNSQGVTVYLEWQSGTINPQDSIEVGLSWTPNQAGQYTVRTFAISSIAGHDVQVLSQVAESKIVVVG